MQDPYVIMNTGFKNTVEGGTTTEECVDPAIDLSQVVPILIKGGYDGAIATEYEGQRMVQDIYPFSSVEMVRRHQVMLRRLLGEI